MLLPLMKRTRLLTVKPERLTGPGFLGLFLVIFATSGCARRLPVAGKTVQSSFGVTAWLGFLKDKKEKFDIGVKLRNERSETVIINTNDVHCSRGSMTGVMRDGFEHANQTITLRAGVTREWVVICELGSPGAGDFRFVIDRVYRQNPQTGLQGTVLGGPVAVVFSPAGALKALADSPAPGRVAVAAARPPRSSAPAATAPPPVTVPPPVAAPAMAAPSVTPVATPKRPRPPAVAHPDWVIAVMEVEDVNSRSKKKRIDQDLIRNIGDQLRIFVAERGIRTIDRSAQDEAFKEAIGSMKAESYKSCYDDSCQIELGKALAATHILRTKITRFGSRCVLNGELIDLRKEVAVAAASSRGDCGAEGFLGMSEDVAVTITAR